MLGDAGVGVATSARQQQHRQALAQACDILNAGSQRADSCIAARAASASPAAGAAAASAAAGRDPQQQLKDVTDVALMASKLLADKLAAIASMHYLFAGSQVYNTHLRTLQGGSGAAAAAAAAGSGGVDGAADAGGGNGGSPLLQGLQARPLQQQAHAGQQAGGGNGGRGLGGVAAVADAAPNESGTQNSASSAVELMPPPAAVGSAASAQIEVAAAVEQYIHLAGRWEKVAAANEKFMRQVGLPRPLGAAAAAAAAAAAGAAAPEEPLHLEELPAGAGGGSGSNEALQHKVGQLVLAVGFEMGMWDLLSVLATASQACQAVKELVGAG
jgi:hypothetical protein